MEKKAKESVVPLWFPLAYVGTLVSVAFLCGCLSDGGSGHYRDVEVEGTALLEAGKPFRLPLQLVLDFDAKDHDGMMVGKDNLSYFPRTGEWSEQNFGLAVSEEQASFWKWEVFKTGKATVRISLRKGKDKSAPWEGRIRNIKVRLEVAE